MNKEQVIDTINNYMGNGYFWCPALADHDKVRDLLLAIRHLLESEHVKNL